MTIGEKIKYLRQKHDVTQEKLAEYLNISYQAISKWENHYGMPDVSLIVPIANFFGISIDELFDRTSDSETRDMNAYLEKEHSLSHAGLIDERIPLWREAAGKYPKNYKCLQMLANALWRSKDSKTLSFEEKTKNLEESIELNERILRDCTDDAIRYSALQILVLLYRNQKYPFADEKKAVAYAEKAPSFYVSREFLLAKAYFTEDSLKKAEGVRHQLMLSLMDKITRSMVENRYYSIEEKILARESAIAMWNTLIYDGNFQFYHCRMAELYEGLAKLYAISKNSEKTVENARLALYHAEKYDSLPSGVTHYTSVFVNAAIADSARTTKSDTETMAELLKKTLGAPCFDFVREDLIFEKC